MYHVILVCESPKMHRSNYLPCGRGALKVGKVGLEPVVDFSEGEVVAVGRLPYCLYIIQGKERREKKRA